VDDQADRVARAVRQAGVDAVIAVGHSSGGYVATAMAERHPRLVRAIALINTGPSPDALRPQPVAVRVLTRPPLRRVVWAMRRATIPRALSSAFTRPVEIPTELVAAAQAMTYRAFARAPQALAAYIADRPVPLRLGGLGIPLLVIFGAADRRWDPASATAYDEVPGAQVTMLPGIGHTPMFEAADATSELLLAFADRIRCEEAGG
jgi:pimeloyl-ACP methyl ester carboxylesterase